MARLSVVIALAVCSVASGCVLPEFQNGPASDKLQDASVLPDARDEWAPEDVVVDPDSPDATDATDATDAKDEPDAQDEPDVVETEAGFCQANSDGTICGPGDACNEHLCTSGACVLTPIPDGVECAPAPNPCYQPALCNAGVCATPAAYADGTNWDPLDTWRRCCGGQALRMDTAENCGVCGIKCNTSDGQSCNLNAANGKYYCEGCAASANCWSGCCAITYGQPYRCAASDCSGNCITCPGGASCIESPGLASLVCAYE